MISPPRYWREIPQRYRLEAAKCKKCGKIFYPPRVVCSQCQHREFEKIVLPNTGKIDTFTVIRVPPSQFEDLAPYAVGIIELDNGVRITSQIVDCEFNDIEIGKPVRLEFRRIQTDGESGILAYGHKCVLT
ncbi:MAG: transcriptional regulator [Candidatus Schekmanbacteria bacterium RBG_13_48_7]|uniref:Transcriptional regulator n=1 Tax=Candidatus Schekmanbacteria bacterium RBG_13_48_7 TaxID=1817878 RepID=A0A1F7RVK9_9BACT|nr:MAG: transcriptional regulator [Candidatus Schekmanbacteria bacterium RBG_13_48_7]